MSVVNIGISTAESRFSTRKRKDRAKGLKYALADFVRDYGVNQGSHCFNTLD